MDYELSSCSSSSSDEFIKTLLRSEEEEEVIHYIRRPYLVHDLYKYCRHSRTCSDPNRAQA